ncbi:uncharacterized protein LOC105664517 [Ceratitis capitata]|uniref:Uncharacterized protein n=1 Tax=Ceratitis capitata TaxID=7213 RepID=W8CEA8_CERCA|nr:uncharacterized protein LOC105664517 [Ceratitis capitata]
MGARRNAKKRSLGTLRNFGPKFNRRLNQGLLNFHSWHAQVFIEILGTMLTEPEFVELVFEPLTGTYARFIRNARRNIWSAAFSNRLVVRVKYRRHAQRLIELLGAILSRDQFIPMVLQPIILTYIEIYTKQFLGYPINDSCEGYDDDEWSSDGTFIDSVWNCSAEAYASTPYQKLQFDESLNNTWAVNSMTALIPFEAKDF